MTISSARDPLQNEDRLLPAPIEYQVPIQNRIARAFLRPIFRDLFHILAQVRITGKENVREAAAMWWQLTTFLLSTHHSLSPFGLDARKPLER